jgi:hypothetical protein
MTKIVIKSGFSMTKIRKMSFSEGKTPIDMFLKNGVN